MNEIDISLLELGMKVQIDPTNAHIFAKRGRLRLLRHDYDGAIADFSEVLRLASGAQLRQWSFLCRGIARAGIHNEAGAMADYNEVIKLEADSVAGYCSRGHARVRKQDCDTAIDEFSEAIRLDPQSASAYCGRAFARAAKQDHEGAIADYSEAIRLDSNCAHAYVNRAVARIRRLDYGGAKCDFNEAIRIDPNRVHAYANLGWLMATCPDENYRDGPNAVRQALRAVELSREQPGRLLGCLAAAYAEAGQFDEAIRWQTKANTAYSESDKQEWSFLLDLYQSRKPYRDVPQGT